MWVDFNSIGLISLQEEKHQISLSLSLLLSTNTEAMPCKDVLRRWLFASQEERSHQKTTLAPLSWTIFQNLEKIDVCCINHPVHNILLWQPQQTNTSILHTFLKCALVILVLDPSRERSWCGQSNIWKKVEVIGTRMGHTDFVVIEGKQQPWHLGRSTLDLRRYIGEQVTLMIFLQSLSRKRKISLCSAFTLLQVI